MGFRGALFTSRDTCTLPFLWAGPFTSTERSSLQGMSGSKLLGGLAGCTDERETHQNAPPPPPPTVHTSGPSPQPTSPAALRPSRQMRPPPSFSWPRGAWYRGHLIFSPLSSSYSSPHPPQALCWRGCQVSGEPRQGSPQPPSQQLLPFQASLLSPVGIIALLSV